jgi:SSS family solute:Na+ symporter
LGLQPIYHSERFSSKSLDEAKKGLIFAGFLKILIPFIVVIQVSQHYVMYTYPQDIPGIQEGYFNVHGNINVSDDVILG